MLERKVVTILFADLVGSTPIAGRLDPELLREFMSRYRDAVADEVQQSGGTMEKFIGDAVMAVFGYPQAHDDDPERAVRAAFAIRSAVAGLHEHEQLAVRIGICTGEVVADPLAAQRGEFVVSGEVVHLAQRLQAAADPDEILVDERTWADTKHRIEYEGAGRVALKGVELPVAAYRAQRPWVAHIDEIAFVGREYELALLELLFTKVTGERRPHLVTIIGPPGVGKSRIAQEFRARLATRQPQTILRVAACKPYREAHLYCPVAGVLSAELVPELDELRAPEPFLDVLTENIRRICTDCGRSDAGADRLARVIASSVRHDCGVDPPPSREEFFRAWRLPIEMHAHVAPVVVTFENIQWSSDEPLDFIESLPVKLADLPVLVIATGRPELLERRPRWGGGAGDATILQLGALPGADGRAIISQLLPGEIDPPLVSFLEERSEGNPHYLIEFARTHIEARSIAEENGKWHLRVDPASVRVPDSVQGAVAARIDGLPPDEKHALLLGAYAAYSRFFYDRPMRMMGDLDNERLDAALNGLLAKGLAREIEEPGVPGMFGMVDGVRMFEFGHLQLREVAHEMVPKSERSRLHLAFLDWLEELMVLLPDTRQVLEQIGATHAFEAWRFQNQRGEGDHGLAERALEYSLVASRADLDCQAPREAADDLRRALEIARESLPERVAEVEARLAEAEREPVAAV